MELATIAAMAGVGLTVGAFALHGGVARAETDAANAICQTENTNVETNNAQRGKGASKSQSDFMKELCPVK